MRTEFVHAGNPAGIHRGFLFLRILAPVALDFDDQVQGIVRRNDLLVRLFACCY